MIGSRHSSGGIGNQDAFLTWPRWLPAARVIGAVSDGHGGLPHFRSEVGARCAVAAAGNSLRDVASLGEGLRAHVIGEWRAAVASHAAAHPLNGAERLIADGRIDTRYGATLLAASVGRAEVHLLQIGDGSIRLGYSDGRIARPMRAVEPYRNGQTRSLCLRDAERYLEHVCRPADEGTRELDFVMLATDGVTRNFADEDAVDAVARRLRRFALAHPAAIVKGLGECLGRMAVWGRGDDSSLWIAVRHSAFPGMSRTRTASDSEQAPLF